MFAPLSAFAEAWRCSRRGQSYFWKLISYFTIFGWVFVAVTGLSLVAASRTTLPGCSEQASHCSGFSCRAQTLESLGFNSCVAWVLLPWGMWSDPWSRDQTDVLCTGKWILNNWTTREVPIVFCFTLLKKFFYWSLVDWQCYAYFRGIAKWISYMYTYIHSFSDSFPLYVMLEHWVEFPVLLRRSLLVILYIEDSFRLSPPGQMTAALELWVCLVWGTFCHC